MKKTAIIENLCLAGLAIVALVLVLTLFAGCSTTSTGASVPNPAVLTMVSQEAASVGTTMWLASHPDDKDKFVLARTALRGLVAAGNGTPADLQAALSLLPFSQLSGNNGAVLVSGAVLLIDAAGKQTTSLNSVKPTWENYVLPVATGLVAGFDQALGP